MYTTYALPAIDTLNSHGGLFLFSLIWILGSMIVSAIMDFEWYGGVVVYLIGVGIAAGVSYNTGSIKEYPNVKVEGTLVGMVAEGYNAEVRSGKSVRRQDYHYLYAIYEIEGMRVPIQVSTNVPLPEHAVFYKN